MPQPQSLFVLRSVSVHFGAVHALSDVDLEISAAGVTALIGPSGSGKTTLLKVLSGLLAPTQGSVSHRDAPLRGDETYRRKLGYVIQDGGLFPHLSAQANVSLVARHLGWPADKRAQRVAELADLVQIPADRLQSYPSELSGGQRQRVGLMRALFLDPDMLFLDEPFGALDPLIRFDLQQQMSAIIRDLGKAAILVTHDLGEAKAMAQQIVLMHGGRVAQAGRFDDLLERPVSEFVTRFVQAQRGLAA